MANYANLPAPSPEQGLNRYLQEIRKFPMLEQQQEYMLAKRWVEDEDTDAVAPAEAEEQEEATSNVIAVECYSKARNSKARNELIGTDAKLAQALKMVARGEKGRSGPKVDGAKQFKHIHIGGGGTDNLLFQANSDGGVVLGRIDFHMQNALNKAEKKRIKDVAGRSGTTVTLTIDGNRIS